MLLGHITKILDKLHIKESALDMAELVRALKEFNITITDANIITILDKLNSGQYPSGVIELIKTFPDGTINNWNDGWNYILKTKLENDEEKKKFFDWLQKQQKN